MTRIAIVGAGIGGLTSALALSGQGHEITLVERRTGFSETGAGIQLSPNASRVLLGLGLGPALARLATTPDRIVIRRLASGREIGAIALGEAAAQRFGAPYWSIARADLHTTLLDAVRGRRDIRLKVGRALREIRQDGHSVSFACETAGGGQEESEAEILIAADGLWSRARAALGDERSPVPSGYTAYRATVERDVAPADLQGKVGGLWLGPGRHVVHYPIRGGREINLVAVGRRREMREGWSTPVESGRVAEAFADADPALRSLLAAASSWTAWSLCDLPVDRMSRGHVALLGDSGHPALPFLAQGGALAIEDAAVLAQEIGGGGQVAERLGRYAARRRARVARVQREARRNARIYHAGGPVAAARDFVLRRLGADAMLDRYGWLYGWRPEGG